MGKPPIRAGRGEGLMRRWGWFLGSLLVALVAFGGWRTSIAERTQAERGWELATRQHEMPQRLPLAGVNVELTQYDDIAAELTQIEALGFVWIRQPFLWSAIEPAQGEYDWSAYDRVVEAVSGFEGRLQLVAVLDGSPAWARHPDAPEHPFAPPASPADYGNFARAVAARYGAVIDVYQIWDEPNIEEHWGQLDPRPALYVAMLDAAYQAIHTEDSQASVLLAALAPTVESGPDNLNDPAYLRAIYELGGRNSFDAVAAKPYGFDSPPDNRTVAVERLNFSRIILLREVMLAYGDGDKPLWGSNFGWNSLPAEWSGPPSIWGQVTQAQKIEYTRQAFQRASHEWPWLGGLILYHWQPDAPADDPIQGFAIASLVDDMLEVVPQSEVMTAGRYPAVNPYSVYSGDWTFSDLGADAGPDAPENTITVTFEGTDLALEVRRGDYLAYLDVTVNGQPANALPRRPDGSAFIGLTSPTREPLIDLIVVAEDLPMGRHTAVICHRPDLGDDQFPIVGFAVGVAPNSDSRPAQIWLALVGLALLSAGIAAWRLPWTQLKLPSPASLRNIGDFGLGLGASGMMMLGALLTWHETLTEALRRDLPAIVVMLATSSILYYAPATWIAVLALLLSGVIIFNRPWLGVLQVLFWSAFFTSTVDPFFRAIAVVEVLLGLTVLATVAHWLHQQAKARASAAEGWRWPAFHPLDAALIGLVAVGTLSLTWAEFLSPAVREWRVILLQPLVFYALIRFLKPSLRDLAFLVETILFTGLMLSLVGLVMYFTDQNVALAEGGTRRLLSVYGSPNALALMLGRCWPFALAYLLFSVSQWRKVWAGLAGGIMLLAIALTQSVGGLLLGLPIGTIIVILAWRGRRALPILAGVGATSLAALLPLSLVLPRLRQLADLENSTTLIRLNLWRSTAQLLQEHPLTGVGLDQFLYTYRSRYILPEAWQDPNLSHPHNVLLDYWVRLGVLGVILAGLLQWYFWRQAWKVYRQVYEANPLKSALITGAMGAMGAGLAHGLVDMAYFHINLSYLFAVLLALAIQVDDAA